MTDQPQAQIWFCGPSQGNCKCQCPDGPCDHKFEGHVDITNEDGRIVGGSTVCTNCGMTAMRHDMWVLQ